MLYLFLVFFVHVKNIIYFINLYKKLDKIKKVMNLSDFILSSSNFKDIDIVKKCHKYAEFRK